MIWWGRISSEEAEACQYLYTHSGGISGFFGHPGVEGSRCWRTRRCSAEPPILRGPHARLCAFFLGTCTKISVRLSWPATPKKMWTAGKPPSSEREFTQRKTK